MRATVGILLLAALAVGGCGSTAKPNPARRAAVPDVRGLEAPDAAVRVLEAHYCVRLEVAKSFRTSTRAQVPVVRQSPAPGGRPRAWSMVTLTIGLPTQTPRAAYGIDVVGAGSSRCPPIRTS